MGRSGWSGDRPLTGLEIAIGLGFNASNDRGDQTVHRGAIGVRLAIRRATASAQEAATEPVAARPQQLCTCDQRLSRWHCRPRRDHACGAADARRIARSRAVWCGGCSGRSPDRTASCRSSRRRRADRTRLPARARQLSRACLVRPGRRHQADHRRPRRQARKHRARRRRAEAQCRACRRQADSRRRS